MRSEPNTLHPHLVKSKLEKQEFTIFVQTSTPKVFAIPAVAHPDGIQIFLDIEKPGTSGKLIMFFVIHRKGIGLSLAPWGKRVLYVGSKIFAAIGFPLKVSPNICFFRKTH